MRSIDRDFENDLIFTPFTPHEERVGRASATEAPQHFEASVPALAAAPSRLSDIVEKLAHHAGRHADLALSWHAPTPQAIGRGHSPLPRAAVHFLPAGAPED
jgi:hypothetical protein